MTELAPTLTPAEEKYFTSRGEAPIPAETPAAEPSPTPEPKAAAQPVPADDGPSIDQLRTQLEESRRQSEETRRRTDRTISEIEARLNPQPQPQDLPDVDQDPVAALRAVRNTVNSWQNQARQVQEQQRIAGAVRDIIGRAAAAETEFTKTTPDYGAAAQHLMSSRADELRAGGRSEPQIQNQVRVEAILMAQEALRNGRSPAEVAYAIAKSRGYKPPAPQPQGRRSGGGSRRPTIETILGMSDGEFAAAFDKMSPAQQRQFFGD